MSETFHYDVFISYAPPDVAEVDKLVVCLEAVGVRVFYDRRLEAGEKFDEAQYAAAIAKAGDVAEVVGSTGLRHWGRLDIQRLLRRAGRESSSPLVVLLPSAPRELELPKWLTERHWLDFRGGSLDDADQVSRLVAALHSESSRHHQANGTEPQATASLVKMLSALPDEVTATAIASAVLASLGDTTVLADDSSLEDRRSQADWLTASTAVFRPGSLATLDERALLMSLAVLEPLVESG